MRVYRPGAGDITGIIANNTSGLGGGCLSGDCTLSLQIDRLTEVTSANVNPLADFLAFVDASETNDPTRKIRTDRFLESINGTGLSVSMSGLLFVSGNAFAESEAFEPAEDRIMFFANDNSHSARRETWTDIATLTAGLGISTTAGAYLFEPKELATAQIAPADDTFIFIDEGTNDDPPRKSRVSSFLLAVAGTGLTATSGVLSVDTVPLTRGGTGGATAAEARTNIQIAPNPSGTPTDTLEKILFGTTVYRHGHPHKGVYDATAIYQQGDIIETGTGINSIFWIAREVISAGQGAPANDDLGLWWRAAGHGYFRGTLEDAQTYDIYSGDYYISDNELWVAFQTLAGRTGSELAGNIDGMDRLLNEIVIRSDGQAPLDSSDNSLTVDHLNEIDFRGAGVEVLAINDTYGQSVAVTIAGGVADDSVGAAQVLTGRGNATIMSGSPVRLNCLSFTPLLAGSGSGIYFTVFAPTPTAPTSTECVEPGYSAQFGTIQAWWDYLTASDNPALWVMLDASGDVASFWESEDPLPSGAPMSIPAGSAFTVIDVGLPTFTVAERLYTTVLTADQRETTLSTWGAYLVERGWLDTLPTTLVDPVTMVTARYQPSAVQWLMRFMAQAAGEITSAFYTDNLVVTGGAWARP